jgi:hypothetical protein
VSIKAIELNGMYVGRKAKISWRTNRKNGVFKEIYVKIEYVYHYSSGEIGLTNKWWHDSFYGKYLYQTFGENGIPFFIPYYADVELLDD